MVREMEVDDKVSFKFSKKIEKKRLAKSDLPSSPKKEKEDDEEEEDRHYITDLKKDDFKRKTKESEFSIKLIESNRLRTEDLEKDDNLDLLTKEAVKELIKDANDTDNKKSSLHIPILMRNKTPGETATKLNLATRPDGDEDDYEKVSMEEYGHAMLRGMGWKDGDIGPPIIEVGDRPRCFGVPIDPPGSKKNQEIIIGVDEEEEDLELKKGAFCIFIAGSKKGQYGTVISIGEEWLYVKSAISGDTINTNFHCLKVVSEKEFEKMKIYLNSSKVEEYTKKEAEKHMKGDGRYGEDDKDKKRDRDRNKEKDREGDTSKERNREKDRKHRKKRSRSSLETASKSKKKIFDQSQGIQQPWLHPHLVVRIIDKEFKNGRHFKEKVTIEDVTRPLVCNCRTSNNKLLEDLHQRQLETVIPRDVPSTVMVVKGEHKFEAAMVHYKDKEDCKVLVNLLGNQNNSLTLDFDDVCQFVDIVL